MNTATGPSLDSAALHWHCLPFTALSGAQVYAILRVRAEVFVVEQNCAYLDIDGKDRHVESLHLFADDAAGAIHAYLRLLAPGVSFAEPSLGRVLTSAAARSAGLGHELMRRALQQAQQCWPSQPIRIGAQAHLENFYARHGFCRDSAEYLEDGIPHIEMRRG